MKMEVDKNICIGCGACAAINPDIFSIDDDGLAIAKDVEITEDKKEDTLDAMEGCPVGAIKEKD